MEIAISQSAEALPVTLPCWSELSDENKAIAWAYASGGYSLSGAATELDIPVPVIKKALQNPQVRGAIAEIQTARGEIDFLNEKWVKEQLFLLYPKLLGEEEIPLVTSGGEQIMARKFNPEAALKVLDYIVPKKTGPAVVVNVANISRLTDEQLEKIAMAGSRTILSGTPDE